MFFTYISVLMAAGRGLGLSTIAVIWIAAGVVITLLLVPWLYRRSLRKRQREQSLRQYLMQDEKLRESVLEHYGQKQYKSPADFEKPSKPQAG
jgi:Na+/melibiose symporter-like transporter